MELPVLMRQFAEATGFPVYAVFSDGSLTSISRSRNNLGLFQALLSSLPANLPSVWTFLTPEGVLGGGLYVPEYKTTLIIAPVFSFECTLQTARRLSHRLSLPDTAAARLQQTLNQYTPCDMKKLQHYLAFLNHFLNDQPSCEITMLDFHWSSSYRTEFQPGSPLSITEGPDLEADIIRLIRGGKEKELIRYFNENLFIYDSQHRMNNVRQQRRYLIGANMLLSRLAIQSGVDRDLINSIVDTYGIRIETIVSQEDFNHIFLEFCLRYTRLIAQLHLHDSPSLPVRRLERYIQAHLYEPITLASISEALGYSKSYLASEYKKVTGETVTQYIQEAKIREASLLLSDHRMQVREVSEALGFSDPSYFVKVYRKHTGRTPGQITGYPSV